MASRWLLLQGGNDRNRVGRDDGGIKAIVVLALCIVGLFGIFSGRAARRVPTRRLRACAGFARLASLARFGPWCKPAGVSGDCSRVMKKHFLDRPRKQAGQRIRPILMRGDFFIAILVALRRMTKSRRFEEKHSAEPTVGADADEGAPARRG
jgi:hypothetical protein